MLNETTKKKKKTLNNRRQRSELIITPRGVLLKCNYRLSLNIKQRPLTGVEVVEEEDVSDCI